MENNIKQKVNRIGLVGQILSIVMIVGSIATIGFIAYRSYIAFQTNFSTWFDLIEYYMSELLSYISSALSIVVYILMFRMSAGFRHCDSPFEDNVIRRMKRFAWSLLILSFVIVLSHIPQLYWGLHYQNGIDIAYAVITFVVPSLWTFIALSVLFLTKIFSYGAQLQQQADETL